VLAAQLVEAAFISHKLFFSSVLFISVLSAVILTAVLIQVVSAEEDSPGFCQKCHEIRHGFIEGKNSCSSCHYNTTVKDEKHISSPFVPGYMHDSFDWEGDNENETGFDRLNESCQACHKGGSEIQNNLCEGCHVIGNSINNSKYNAVRKDIDQYTPKIYSHYTGSDIISVSDQSGIGKTASSCFGFDPGTGEGTCHGVTFANKEKAGGFYAQNFNYTGVLGRSDPYHWNAPVDAMPDTTNCIFCHLQKDEEIRKAWGNPSLNFSNHDSTKLSNENCWDCHYDGKPRNFHSKKVEKNYWIFVAIASVGIVAYVIWRKKQKTVIIA